MRQHRGLSLLAVCIALLAPTVGGCFDGARSWVYVPPQSRADGLRVGEASAIGLDTSRIGGMIRELRTERFGEQTSLLVLKDSQLIIEEYFDRKPQELRPVQSVSKSITSLLVGHGLAQGWIDDIDDPIAKYLPTYQHLLTGGKERITIRHLLTMTSGLAWNEWDLAYADSTNLRVRERGSPDGVAFVLSHQLARQPGEAHAYNGGGVTVLGEILKVTSGLSSDAIVQRALAGMLDTTEIHPTFQKDGRLNAAGGFEMTSRGMAKIGQLILQNGVWNGDTLFDPRWISESTGAVMGLGQLGYGYLWWRHAVRVGDRRIEAVVADGLGGQYIVIVPDLGIVIAMTAENYDLPVQLESLIDHVLPALGPYPFGKGRVIASVIKVSAYPPPSARWSEIVSAPNPANGGARIRVAVDTASARQLDDGSWLVWFRFDYEKPLTRAGTLFDRQNSRLILRCETPTDTRFKDVSTARFLTDSAPVFQDGIEVREAMTGEWKRAWGGSLDLAIFQGACRQLLRTR